MPSAVNATNRRPRGSSLGIAAPDAVPDCELPPGQQASTQFPDETPQRAPKLRRAGWTLTISEDDRVLRSWDRTTFQALPHEAVDVDLHSELGWSKLATSWRGVSLHVLFAGVQTRGEYVCVGSDGEYTTNLPLEDLLEMPTWIADGYEGRPLARSQGGPARLLVPHLYLYKSAKWVRSITVTKVDQPGTHERGGLHNYGDPWRQQRYAV